MAPYLRMISLDLYFFHIEKCAGTSLRRAIYEAFRDRYEDEQIHIPGYNRPGDVTIRNYADNLRYFERLKIVADHSNPGELEALLDIPVRVAFRLVALRHPVDRALSHFHHFYGKPASLHEMQPERLTRFMTRHGTLQTMRLSNDKGSLDDALRALASMDSIVIAEDYARSVALLNRVCPFGVRFDQAFRENVTARAGGVGYQNLYSEDYKRSLERYCAPDLRLYAEARRLFDEMCARAGI